MDYNEEYLLKKIEEIGIDDEEEAERILAFYNVGQNKFDNDEELTEYLDDICSNFDSDTNTMDYGGEYLILTDEEADEAVKESILSSVEYFNPDWVSYYTSIDDEEAIRAIQDTRNANETLISLMKAENRLEDFIEDSVSADGRGHFLNTYDGSEYEEKVNRTDYYIYQIN